MFFFPHLHISSFLFFICLTRLILQARYYTQLALNIGYSESGTTKVAVCPDGKWMGGFYLKNDCNGYGTMNVIITCLDINFENKVEAMISPFSKFSGGTATALVSCNSGSFVNSYKKRGYCCGFWTNDQALNDLYFKCTHGDELISGGCNAGSWTSYATCPAQTAACGYEVSEGSDVGMDDDLSLLDITLYCCPICKVSYGFYLNTNKCVFCDDNCFTCSGISSTDCTSCGGTDVLSASSCTVSSNSARKVYDFYVDANMGTDLSNYVLSGNSQTTCGDWKIIRLTGNGYLQRTLTGLTPHYKARIKVRIFKIDTWGGSSIQITVDSNSLPNQLLTTLQDSDDQLFFGNICEGANNEDIIQIDQDFSHFSSTLVYKISGAYTFGVRNLKILIYKCDYTCKSCSEAAATKCTECYDHATLSSGSCACDDGYLVATTTPCDLAVCSVCNSCWLGCKKCTGLTATECTSCLANYFLDGIQVIFFYFGLYKIYTFLL